MSNIQIPGANTPMLRVARVVDGRILLERHVPSGATLTAGSTERCDVVLPGVAPTILAESEANGFRVHAAGRLRSRRGATTTGSLHLTLPADEPEGDSHALLDLQGHLLLFEVVAVPPKPKAKLPPFLMRRVWDHIDTRFVVAQALTAFIIGTMIVLTFVRDDLFDARPELESVYATLVFTEVDLPEPIGMDDALAQDAAPRLMTPLRVEPRVRPTDASRAPRLSTADVATAGARVREGLAGLFTNVADGAAPVRASDLLGPISEHASTSPSAAIAFRDGAPSTTDANVTLHATGPVAAASEGQDLVEQLLRVDVAPPDSVTGAGEISTDTVTREMRRRRAAFALCYSHALRVTPGLRGKVEIAMTIEESGLPTNVSVVSNSTDDDAVASCIAGVVRRMRFTAPTDGNVRMHYPFVLMPP
jgi:hypothetical protein